MNPLGNSVGMVATTLNGRKSDTVKCQTLNPTPSFGVKKDTCSTTNEKLDSPKRPPRKNLQNQTLGSSDPFHSRLHGGSRSALYTKPGGHRMIERAKRTIQHHSFITDTADVKQIEQGLLQLMEDFQTGNLRAFGKDSKLHQMEAIRQQQEKLARLHFEVGAEQDLYPPLSDEGIRISLKNKKILMEKLAQLSESIEKLHTTSNPERKCSNIDRKVSSSCGTNSTMSPMAHQIHNMSKNSAPLPPQFLGDLSLTRTDNYTTPLSSRTKNSLSSGHRA